MSLLFSLVSQPLHLEIQKDRTYKPVTGNIEVKPNYLLNEWDSSIPGRTVRRAPSHARKCHCHDPAPLFPPALLEFGFLLCLSAVNCPNPIVKISTRLSSFLYYFRLPNRKLMSRNLTFRSFHRDYGYCKQNDDFSLDRHCNLRVDVISASLYTTDFYLPAHCCLRWHFDGWTHFQRNFPIGCTARTVN